MAKSRAKKQEMVEVLASNIKTAKSMVFANFQGLKVKESEELRAKCREQGIEYMATKKTIMGKALKDAGIDIDVSSFDGSMGVAFGLQDEIAPAQVLAQFAKTHEVAKIYGGILEGKFIDGANVKALAALPSKQQLLGQLVGTLNAPVSGFVNVLAGNMRGLMNVLNALKEQKA